jgi:hypothetical protein
VTLEQVTVMPTLAQRRTTSRAAGVEEGAQQDRAQADQRGAPGGIEHGGAVVGRRPVAAAGGGSPGEADETDQAEVETIST